jgi:structure-specific recognition protein 1
VKVNIIIPGTYRSEQDNQSVKCSVRANPGFIFPLQKSMIFLYKPVIYIRFEEIRYIEFARVSERSVSSVKSFDMHVVTRDNTHQFTGIDRAEYQKLYTFFEKKKLTLRKIEEVDKYEAPNLEVSESDEEDY